MKDASSHFRDRGALIAGLMAGELDAAEAVARTRPAVELLGLLIPVDGLTEDYLRGRAHPGLEVTRSDFEPWRRPLLAVVAALLERWVGADTDAWLRLVARAGAYAGSVSGLIASVADGSNADPALWAGRAPRWPRGVDASAVLLAMAPPGIVEAFLDSCVTSEASRGILTRMLDRGPLHPLYLDYALGGLGTGAMFDALYRNPAYAVSQLRALVLRDRSDVAVLEYAYCAPGADRALRIGCVRLADAVGGFRARFLERLETSERAILAEAETEAVSVGPPCSELELGAPQIEPWPYTDLIREYVHGDTRRRVLVDNPAADVLDNPVPDRPSSVPTPRM